MAELALGHQRLTGCELDFRYRTGDGVEFLLRESDEEGESGDAGPIHSHHRIEPRAPTWLRFRERLVNNEIRSRSACDG